MSFKEQAKRRHLAYAANMIVSELKETESESSFVSTDSAGVTRLHTFNEVKSSIVVVTDFVQEEKQPVSAPVVEAQEQSKPTPKKKESKKSILGKILGGKNDN